MINCPKCGEQIENNKVICPQCGYNFDNKSKLSNKKIPSYLFLAIVLTIFCFPVGIFAIVKSIKVHKKIKESDYEGVVKASKSAGRWCAATFLAGILLISYCNHMVSQFRQQMNTAYHPTPTTEAKRMLNVIINLEEIHLFIDSTLVAFDFDEDCPEIGFESPDDASFYFKFEIDSNNLDNSIASAIEKVDVNGDGDTNDGLTLSVEDVQGTIGDLTW